MIIDQGWTPENEHFDVCIIGSGAIGITLAVSFLRVGKKVIVLEAGANEIDDETQVFSRCESTGHPHSGSSDARFRVRGGSTERWGGQAMRFETIDTKARLWAEAPDWVVPFETLEAYYPAAEKMLGLEDPPYETLLDEVKSWAKRLTINPSRLQGAFEAFTLHNSVFTRMPRLREKYRQELASEAVTVLQRAVATKILTNGSGLVTGLLAKREGLDIEISADRYILATGGVENARFLLIQKKVYGIRELEAQDNIGRFFQDHPGIHLAEVTGIGAALLQNAFRLKSTLAMNSKGRISWSAKERRESQLMAVSATFLMTRRPSPFDSEKSHDRVRLGTFSDWTLFFRCLTRGVFYSPLHYTVLAVSAEDIRDSESKITLSENSIDPLGFPSAVVNWKVAPKVAESIAAFGASFSRAYQQMSLGAVRNFAGLSEPASILAKLQDNSHHVGTTSMGGSINVGVVDQNLKAYGFANLWVAGTSVLPTGSHANPTLTAVALGLRLADHIFRDLKCE